MSHAGRHHGGTPASHVWRPGKRWWLALTALVATGAISLAVSLRQPAPSVRPPAPVSSFVPSTPRTTAFGWRLTSAMSAHRALVLEVETARLGDAAAVAHQLAESYRDRFDEVLVFFFEPEANPRRASLRVQWTRAGGYRTLALRASGGAAHEAGALERTVAEVDAGRKTTPLVGAPTPGGEVPVTFLARRIGHRVPRIVSDVTGWGEHADGTFDFTVGSMTQVGGTDWYSLHANVAPGARIEYLLVYGATDYRLDPHNPRRSAGRQFGGARASEFVTVGYVPPPEFTEPPVAPAGRTTAVTMRTQALHGSERLVVYTPPGYRAGGDYRLAVFLDGRSEHVSRVLDWLITQHLIQPLVAVFVKPPSLPGRDGAGNPLSSFLARELLSWVSSRYAVSAAADHRAIIGISFGAKDALEAALASGDGFGRLGLLIPGRRIGTADIAGIGAARDRRLRAAIVGGRYDRANVATARRVQRALAQAGHRVDYTEVPEGHSAVTWLYNLRVVLVSLFGKSPAVAD